MPRRSCLYEIHARLESFTGKERQVADHVLANPAAAVDPSIEELAERIGVSESTLFRFVRKLGYDGYQQFRIALATETVVLLAREGMIDADFWARLEAERPRRKADIDKVREQFVGKGSVPVPVPGRQGVAPASPQIITVLLVSANPDTTVRLRVDKEFRDVIVRMRGSKFRDRFKFVQVLAARFDDLTTALQEHEPHVLHISSHGESDDSLIFEGKGDTPQKVSKRLPDGSKA